MLEIVGDFKLGKFQIFETIKFYHNKTINNLMELGYKNTPGVRIRVKFLNFLFAMKFNLWNRVISCRSE